MLVVKRQVAGFARIRWQIEFHLEHQMYRVNRLIIFRGDPRYQFVDRELRESKKKNSLFTRRLREIRRWSIEKNTGKSSHFARFRLSERLIGATRYLNR